MLAYITGSVDPVLLLRNEYLAAENRILPPHEFFDPTGRHASHYLHNRISKDRHEPIRVVVRNLQGEAENPVNWLAQAKNVNVCKGIAVRFCGTEFASFDLIQILSVGTAT